MEKLHPDVPTRPERSTQERDNGGMALEMLTDSKVFLGSACRSQENLYFVIVKIN